MNLVETHIIKKQNRFYKEMDLLCFLSKNLGINFLSVYFYYSSNKLYKSK